MMVKSFFAMPDAAPVSPVRWWQTDRFWWVLALLSTAPFWFTALPPLGDLFSHMGRYHILLNHSDSTFLQRYYRLDWSLIPNLGQDLPMMLFGPIFGVERGAILLTAAIPALTVVMIGKLSRAAHGSVQPVAFLALPFAYPMTLSFGFVNFHTGVVCALAAVLFWFRSSGMASVWRYGLLAILAVLTWLCHASAWAILVVGIASLELASAVSASEGKFGRAFLGAVLRTCPVALPFLLFMFGPEQQANSGQERYDFFDLDTYLKWYWLKFSWVLYPLRDQVKLLDYATLVVIFAIPALLFLSGKLKLHFGLAVWSAVLFGLFWILPQNLLGGYYADFRLLSVMGIAALLAGRILLDRRAATVIAMFGLCLFAVRLAYTSAGWVSTGERLEHDLEALALVPSGARVAAVAPEAYCGGWKMEGYSHLASLAIVRRDAFVSSQWDLPGQQVTQPVHLPGSKYNSIQTLDGGAEGSDCGTIATADFVNGLPRDQFDYVWIFKADVPDDIAPWLVSLYRGSFGHLYAIRVDLRPESSAIPPSNTN